MPHDHLREREQQGLLPAWDAQRPGSQTLANLEVGQHRAADDKVTGDHYEGPHNALDMYDWKSLLPQPLDPNRGSHRTSRDQSWCANYSKSNLVSPSESQPNYTIRSCFRGWIKSNVNVDQDPKNKPLPLEPFYDTDTRGQGPFGPTYDDPLPRLCRQPNTLFMEEVSEQRLLTTFFGFDLIRQSYPLNNAKLHRVRQYLASQPHPDTMVNSRRYPIVSCAWLRNFIVASPYRLNIDRGRLRGLRLDDNSSHNVHCGFGLLWDFVKACGPKNRDSAYVEDNCGEVADNCDEVDKEGQLQWLRYRNVQPAETEHMLQIWNVLKFLLIEHSALRQTRRGGPEKHTEEIDVVGFMKRGLGKVQQYFTGLNNTRDLFWDGSNIDGFFEAACVEWQDN